VIGLVTHLGSAVLATIFVFIPLGQDQKQEFSYRDGSTAFGAIQLQCLKFLEISLWFLGPLLIGGNKIVRTVFHKCVLGLVKEVVLI